MVYVSATPPFDLGVIPKGEAENEPIRALYLRQLEPQNSRRIRKLSLHGFMSLCDMAHEVKALVG